MTKSGIAATHGENREKMLAAKCDVINHSIICCRKLLLFCCFKNVFWLWIVFFFAEPKLNSLNLFVCNKPFVPFSSVSEIRKFANHCFSYFLLGFQLEYKVVQTARILWKSFFVKKLSVKQFCFKCRSGTVFFFLIPLTKAET
jgi:hypothetical protein